MNLANSTIYVNIGFTLLSVLFFVGVVYFAFSKKNKTRWEKSAMIPFEEEKPSKTVLGSDS